MDQIAFLEMVLDNITDGIYVLDDKGNYVYVNSAYIKALNMPKGLLLNYNVHDFLDTGQINLCISDIVYREKRQVVMFQDVYDTQDYGRKLIRQMVISTPVFNQKGNIRNVVAIVRSQETSSDLYYKASISNATSVTPSFQMLPSSMEGKIIAKSMVMRSIINRVNAIANVDSTVLISGESGTGKEVIAQYIYECSNRADMPFVIINCASLPENLLEAELFGYEKGAFTGADPNGKKGLFEEADKGILFLDEINSMPLSLQGKLLRAIETKKIKRIGSNKSIPVDFRLISASNEDIAKMVENKQFRLDLYYRINIIPINIPPLRERRADIVPLALNFLEHFCEKHNKKKVFSTNTIDNILNYSWPGNVRQLKNFVERSVVISTDEVIEIRNVEGITEADPIPPAGRVQELEALEEVRSKETVYEEMFKNDVTLDDYLAACEREYLRYVYSKMPSSYKLADKLGVSQSSIMRRLRKYKIRMKDEH